MIGIKNISASYLDAFWFYQIQLFSAFAPLVMQGVINDSV